MSALLLADRARRLRVELARVEAELLEALEREGEELTVTAVADALGHTRQTVYTRLAERQARRDALTPTEPPPASEAPADDHTPNERTP